MNEQEQRNLGTAHQYIELYNNDIERFVPECYTSDCKAYVMGFGVIEGQEQFIEVERTVIKAAPKRRMRLEHTHVSGDVVTLEVTLLNPDAGDDWEIPFVAVLTMRDGKILVDRSYAEWPRWPGISDI